MFQSLERLDSKLKRRPVTLPRLGLPDQGAVHARLQDDQGLGVGQGRQGRIPESVERRGRNICLCSRRLRGAQTQLLFYH
jgi:hypothetical protein